MRSRATILAVLMAASVAARARAAPVKPGAAAPAFTLRRLGGGRLSLSDLRGKVVLLTFWTVGCPPCEVEAPHLQRLHRKYFSKGLRVIGVAPLTGGVEGLHAFVRRHGLTFPTVVDPNEKVVKRYAVSAYPCAILIDRQGVVRWRHEGFVEADARRMEKQIRAEL